MNHQWFVYLNKQNHGPISAEEILRMYQAGTITEKSNVWHEGLAGWIPLAQSGLVAANAGHAPAPTLAGPASAFKPISASTISEQTLLDSIHNPKHSYAVSFYFTTALIFCIQILNAIERHNYSLKVLFLATIIGMVIIVPPSLFSCFVIVQIQKMFRLKAVATVKHAIETGGAYDIAQMDIVPIYRWALGTAFRNATSKNGQIYQVQCYFKMDSTFQARVYPTGQKGKFLNPYIVLPLNLFANDQQASQSKAKTA